MPKPVASNNYLKTSKSTFKENIFEYKAAD
jgi:hypothetical protein